MNGIYSVLCMIMTYIYILLWILQHKLGLKHQHNNNNVNELILVPQKIICEILIRYNSDAYFIIYSFYLNSSSEF